MGTNTNNKTMLLSGLAIAAIALVSPEDAHAGLNGIFGEGGWESKNGGFSIGIGSEAGGIAKALCEVVSWFQGGVGQSIASLAIIFLGIQAFFGKVTWGTALLFATGVFAIFGSDEIVSAITNGKGNGCCGGLNVSVGGKIPGFGSLGASGCASF